LKTNSEKYLLDACTLYSACSEYLAGGVVRGGWASANGKRGAGDENSRLLNAIPRNFAFRTQEPRVLPAILSLFSARAPARGCEGDGLLADE